MIKKKSPDPVDVHVGSRVRMRRLMLGISQEKLGDDLGITFQQVQKYEKGANRVSVSPRSGLLCRRPRELRSMAAPRYRAKIDPDRFEFEPLRDGSCNRQGS